MAPNADPDPCPVPLEHLQRRARQLLLTGIACNSTSTYNTPLSAFGKFRSFYGLPKQLPIPVQQIILFMSFCFEKGLSTKSISTYIAGINYYHKLCGFYDLSNVFLIRKLLEGCHRSRISLDNRAPITMPVLVAICNSLPKVCYDNYEVKLFSSIFILAYFGLFRISELVTVGKYHLGNALHINDVSFLESSTYIVIRLRNFKTNQRGKPVLLKIPEQLTSPCPVRALSEFLFVRPKLQGPLFCHKDSSAVTRSEFSAVLAKSIGQNPTLVAQYKTQF